MSNLLWGSLTATIFTAALGSTLPAIALDTEATKPVLNKNKDASAEVQTVAQDTTEAAEVTAPVVVAFTPTAIYPHQSGNTTAATLFVDQIPVATFIGEDTAPADIRTIGFVTPEQVREGKVPHATATESNPIWRAALVAEQISQLPPEVAANITVNWDAEAEAYAVKLGEQTLLMVDEDSTVLPNTTKNVDQDALSVTNLIRRQVGDAPALSVPNTPRPRYRAAVRSTPVNFSGQRGQASWYGPGFHGRRTANGERYNQNAMTAAHRTLPFGTRVRVTNLNNGRSVVVRINDRGPFIRGRVIDLSRAGAGAIGMIGSGVAPVSVEIVD